MSENFAEFLQFIQSPSKPSFNLRQFKDCNDVDRYKCAKVMFEHAACHPTNVIFIADVARTIITSASLKSTTQKSFVQHLSDIIEAELKVLFKQGHRQEGTKIHNIGMFMSELYLRMGLKTALMNYWLEEVHKSVATDDAALRTLLASLRTILLAMKFRDARTYEIFMFQLGLLSSQDKIPDEFEEWTKSVLGKRSTRAIIAQSLTCEASTSTATAACSDPQRETGAIRKT